MALLLSMVVQICVDVERLRTKRLPVLSALTQNDGIVEWELNLELARHCGATDGQVTYFDEKEQVVGGPKTGLCTSCTFYTQLQLVLAWLIKVCQQCVVSNIRMICRR